ncbi:MAG TPA: tyrosine-type recombinase/integrase [Mycobacterium sp.]|nr:tyrosine-type recombinase/integrase [Mycobacterium sp.]HUH68267.1 tyrosine-type recombinase/integrase [Mycobacterium sp.]
MRVQVDRDDGVVRSVVLVDDDRMPVGSACRFLRYVLNSGSSPNTAVAYAYDLCYLSEFLANRELDWRGFSPSVAFDLLGWLRARPCRRRVQQLSLFTAGPQGRVLAPATIARALAAVSSFYEWAVATELFSGENPLHRRRDLALTSVPNRHQPFTGSASHQQPVRPDVRVRVPSRLPRPMTDAEITALLDSMTNLRDLAMVLLMLDGGERPGEVLSLHLEDIAYGHRRVTVRKRDYHPRGARQKSRRERVVDLLEPRTLDAVNRYVLHERPQEAETPFVFLIGGRGKRLPSRCPTPHLFE